MNIINQGDEKVIKIVKKKHLDPDAEYRVSLFTYPYSENGRYLIHNTLTLETAELSETEWKAFEQIRTGPVSAEYLADNGLEQLVLSRYIVETDHDEVKQYKDLIFILKTMFGGKKGLKTYIIFPTTGCNARCTYCYEEGYAVKNMTVETADMLVDYICETRHDDTVRLKWFGGEPLAGVNIIRHICTSLKECGIPYKSGMITNASLVTKELAHEAKELWNLEKVQVSLDGARVDYEERKRYYAPEKYNYDTVIQAIHYLVDEGIRVLFRVNYDGDNLPRLKGFLDEIKSEFGNMKNAVIYFRALYQEREKDYFIELQRKEYELIEYARSIGLPVIGGANSRSKIRVNCCMADSLDKSVVITPDGLFYNCEHLPENNTWGNIFDGVTDEDKFRELSADAKVDEKCAKCPFLPLCTPFFKNCCPGRFDKCYEYYCLKTEYRMHSLLQGVNTETDDDEEDI